MAAILFWIKEAGRILLKRLYGARASAVKLGMIAA